MTGIDNFALISKFQFGVAMFDKTVFVTTKKL